jgi:hypothetical protein
VTAGDANVPATDVEVAGGSRIRVVRGGTPGPVELAALAIALTPVVVPTTPETVTGRPPIAPWLHAALVEGVGGPVILTPADLGVAAGAARG